jgi:nucleotide-binding universal stress UspA family protein
MYRSLLVPLDGSLFGEHALPLALSIARRAHASLQVVHVHVPPAPMYVEGWPTLEDTLDSKARERERAYLDEVIKRLAPVSTTPVSSALLEGPIADALHEQAVATGVDLVVLTTHGHGPLARFWLGSVADELVRRLPMPLLLVRPQEEAPDLAREQVLQHVLIPLDGTALAERILEPAVALGTVMQADYTLLRVLDPLVTAGHDPAGYPISGLVPEALKQLQVEAEAYLERTAKRLRAQSLRVRTRVVVGSHPAVAILEEASANPTDLIALETHGRRGLNRLLLGSVADKVLRGSSTPVLVHRPADQ